MQVASTYLCKGGSNFFQNKLLFKNKRLRSIRREYDDDVENTGSEGREPKKFYAQLKCSLHSALPKRFFIKSSHLKLKEIPFLPPPPYKCFQSPTSLLFRISFPSCKELYVTTYSAKNRSSMGPLLHALKIIRNILIALFVYRKSLTLYNKKAIRARTTGNNINYLI